MTNKFLFFLLTVLHFGVLSNAQNITKIGYSQIGKASYYPDDRDGKITAGGYKYDKNALAGAHKYFPFGSIVKVRNIDNGKTVLLKIIDRPYTNQRILDVTLKAAQKLDIIGLTDAHVEVTLMDTPETLRKKKEASQKQLNQKDTTVDINVNLFTKTGTYYLNGNQYTQQGFGVMFKSFSTINEAIQQSELLKSAYNFEDILIQTGWKNGEKEFRVLVGEFSSKEEAQLLYQMIHHISITADIKKLFN
ncbi:septal ring lytic transglycosylase RlpA family protein [Flammeovirga pacifica]|uniref:SPOR domain-containing protein n=1 Tax=Flammeovirga pacifica TaxID=915059 RepID=A0A1S1YWY6_FLAPC|nr:septal ring lytic transglycosylase RlpA family protein [Flammeovirga pacifica]OHX65536.1 hypothetical protein NH26_03825 [Flammeovirga pacifica]